LGISILRRGRAQKNADEKESAYSEFIRVLFSLKDNRATKHKFLGGHGLKENCLDQL